MATIDIILILPLLWGLYNGYQRGILIEVITVIAFVISVVAGFRLLGWAIEFISPQFQSQMMQRLLPYLGFSVIFFPIIFLIVRLGWMLRRTIRYTVFGSFDSLAGAAVGLFTWAFGASVFLWMIVAIGVKIPENATKNAILMPLIKPLAPKIIGKATEEWIPKGAEKLRAIKDGR